MDEPFASNLSPQRVLRILVAEDNEDAAATQEALLKMLGHEVWVASTGPAAIEAARRHLPDVLVCDIGLPGLSGYEVAKAVRSEPACRGMTMIAVTGYGDEHSRADAIAAGFDLHFSKGGNPLEMLRELEGVANRGPAQGNQHHKNRLR